MLTELDGTVLAAYCQSFARWKQAEGDIDENGLTFDNKVTGVRHRNPSVEIAQREKQVVRQFSALFGLSPADRGRMSIPETNDEECPHGLEPYRCAACG